MAAQDDKTMEWDCVGQVLVVEMDAEETPPDFELGVDHHDGLVPSSSIATNVPSPSEEGKQCEKQRCIAKLLSDLTNTLLASVIEQIS